MRGCCFNKAAALSQSSSCASPEMWARVSSLIRQAFLEICSVVEERPQRCQLHDDKDIKHSSYLGVGPCSLFLTPLHVRQSKKKQTRSGLGAQTGCRVFIKKNFLQLEEFVALPASAHWTHQGLTQVLPCGQAHGSVTHPSV